MEPMDDRIPEEKYKIYDFINTSNDIERVSNYIIKLYPNLVTKFYAKVAAQKMLDKGITAEAILDGSFDKYIHNYVGSLKEMIDELLSTFFISESDAIKILHDLSNKYYFDINDLKSEKMKEEIASTYDIIPKEIKEESVKVDNEATEILLRVQKKKKNARVVAMLLCGIGIVGIFNYAYKEGKREIESAKTRKELTTIANLDVKEGTFTNQSMVKSGDIKDYNYSQIASSIINGCSKNQNLFDYYMYDTYLNFKSARKFNNPIVMMDKVLDELNLQLASNTELQSLYERTSGYDCFLEYLYKEGFISHTDSDYYIIGQDIEKYKLLKMSGLENPLESAYFPKESSIRLNKLVNAFTSMKYDATLFNEFKDDIEDLTSGGRG